MSETSLMFDSIANHILNFTTLIASNSRYRIQEIEFYYYNEKDHPDPYVHKSEVQKLNGFFYFHTHKNGTYKSGTYKGLDITLGRDGNYFGILIRSMINLENNNLISGPCCVVNEILNNFGFIDVASFMKGKDTLSISDVNSGLYLIDEKHNSERMYSGPRIGLSNKFPEYMMRNYRYIIFIDLVKKEKRKLTMIDQS